MEPWPLEEALARPLLSVGLAIGLPALARSAARRLTRSEADRRAALAVLGLASLAFGALVGVTALGPRWVPRALGPWSAASAAALAAAAHLAVAGGRPRPGLLGPDALRAEGRLGAALGAVLALVLLALPALPWAATRIAEAEAPATSGAAAFWRLRVDPWDGVAMLAAAWAARRAEALPLALRRAEEARRLGASEPAVLELRAEVAAARGDCPRAERLFDRAVVLRARAAATEAAILEAPLALGGYTVPPSLATRCGRGAPPPTAAPR